MSLSRVRVPEVKVGNLRQEWVTVSVDTLKVNTDVYTGNTLAVFDFGGPAEGERWLIQRISLANDGAGAPPEVRVLLQTDPDNFSIVFSMVDVVTLTTAASYLAGGATREYPQGLLVDSPEELSIFWRGVANGSNVSMRIQRELQRLQLKGN